MGAIRKLASQTAIYGLSSIVGRVLNWGLTPMYASYFAPDEFGSFSDLYAQLIFPLTLITLGLETTFFRFADKELPASKAYAQSFLTVAYLAILLSVILGINSDRLAIWMGYEGQGYLYGLLIGITALDAIAALPMARLRQQEKVLRFTGITVSNVIVTLVLNILFVSVLRLPIYWVFIANLIASAVKLVLACYGNMPETWRLEAATIRLLVNYGVYIMLIGVLGQINEQLDKIMLPRVWPENGLWRGKIKNGMEMNAIYNVSYKIAMAMGLATQAFRYAAEPYFFKQAGQQNDTVNTARIFHFFVLSALSFSLLISLFAVEIVSFDLFGLSPAPLFKPYFWEGVTVVPLILLANVFFGAYITVSTWFKITGQLRFGLFFGALGAVITIVLNTLLIPTMGYLACGLAHVACYAVMLTLCYSIGQVYRPVPFQVRALLIAVLLVSAAYLIIVFTVGVLSSSFNIVVLKASVSAICILSMWILCKWRPATALSKTKPIVPQTPGPGNVQRPY